MASLADAHAALAAGSWELAASRYGEVARETGDPRAFEGQAQAAWWLDDADRSVGSRSAAYRRYRNLGDDLGAGRAATALAWDSQLFGQGDAVALGWLQRAHDLLDPLDEAEEHGWLAVREAEIALGVLHEPQRAHAAARRAGEIAGRTGAADLAVVALALQGFALATSGDLEGGMPLLDASVAAATSGDVADLMWLGKVCCWLILACEASRDLGRARDWCLRVEQLCVERDLAPLFNVCRITYAGIQVVRGTWDEADRDLTAAIEHTAGSRRTTRLGASVALGELRRRQGRLDEAAALFAQAEFAPGSVVGRALMRCEAGDPAHACRSLEELLSTMPDDSRLVRATVLGPLVEVALAAGRVEVAQQAAAELRATATAAGTDALLAAAHLADARLAGIDPGDPQRSVAGARDAVRRFQAADLGYDEAAARLVLAQGLRRLGDDPGAQEQLERAASAFADLGASAMLAQTEELLEPGPTRRGGGLTDRETEVLRLVADGLSSREIAERLTVSSHTIHRHVANILTKLDQPSRAAAVSTALQRGLL